MLSVTLKQAMRLCCSTSKVQLAPIKAAAVCGVKLSLQITGPCSLVRQTPTVMRTRKHQI